MDDTFFKTDNCSMDSDNLDISTLFIIDDDSIDNDKMNISTLLKMDNDNICISTLFETDDDNMDNDIGDIPIFLKMDDDSMDDNIDISILFKTDNDSMDSDNLDISILFKMDDDSIDDDKIDDGSMGNDKMSDESIYNDNVDDEILDFIKMFDLTDNVYTRECLNTIKIMANSIGIDLVTCFDLIDNMSDESSDRYSMDCKKAALACENRHYLEKYKVSTDDYTTGKDATDDESIDFKVASLEFKNRSYLEKHKMYVYLDDAVAQFISLNVTNEATKIKPAEFLKEYFNSVHEGTHVLFREYSFISSNLFNRLCVMNGIFDIYKPLFFKDFKLNAKECHSLLRLVWPNFPFDVVQASFRSFEALEQHDEICVSFLEFFRAFKSSFCVGRFDYEENVYDKNLETKFKRIVKLITTTPSTILEAYFLHTTKKGRNQQAIMASIISNLDSEFKRKIGFEILIDEPAKVPLSFSGLKLPIKYKKKVTTPSKTLSTSHQVKKNAKQLPCIRCPSQTGKIDAKKKLSSGRQGLQNAEIVKGTGAQIASISKQNVTTVSQTTIANSQEQIDVKQILNSHSPSQIKKQDYKKNSSAGTLGLKSTETDKNDGGTKSLISSSAIGDSKTHQDVTVSSKTSPCRKGKISVKGFPKVITSPVTLIQIERVFTRLLAIQEESNKKSAEKLSSAKSASKSLPNLNTFSQSPSANFWGQVKVKKLSKSHMNLPLLQTEELDAKNNLSSCQQKLETSKIETETSESKQNKTTPSKASSAYRRGQVNVKRFPNNRGPLQNKKFLTKSNTLTVRRRSEIPKMKTEKKKYSVSSRANDISKFKPDMTTISKTISADHPGKLEVKLLPNGFSSSVTLLQTPKKFIRKLGIKEPSNKPAEKTQGRLFSAAKGASKSEPSLNTFYETLSAGFGSVRQLSKSLDSLNLLKTQKLDAEKKSLTCQQISETAKLKTEFKLSFTSSAAKDVSPSMQNLRTSSKASSACQPGQVGVKQLLNVHHHLQTKKSDESQSTFGQKSETTKMKPEKGIFFVPTVVKQASKPEKNVINFSTAASSSIPIQVNIKHFPSSRCLSQTVKSYAEKNSSASTQGLKRLGTVKIHTETYVSSTVKDDSKSKKAVTTFSKTRSTSHRKPIKMNVINVAEQLGWTQSVTNEYYSKREANKCPFIQRSVAAQMRTEKKGTSVSSNISKFKQNVSTFSETASTSNQKPIKINVINVAEQLGWTQSGTDQDPKKSTSTFRQGSVAAKMKTEKKITSVSSEAKDVSKLKKNEINFSPTSCARIQKIVSEKQLCDKHFLLPTEKADTEKKSLVGSQGLGTAKTIKTKTEKKVSVASPEVKVNIQQDAEKHLSIGSKGLKTGEIIPTKTEKPVSFILPGIKVTTFSEALSTSQENAEKNSLFGNQGLKTCKTVKTKTEKKLSNTFPGLKVTPLLKTPSTCHQDSETKLSARSQGLNTRETVKTETEKKSSISSSVIKGTSLSKKKPISVREPYKMNVVNVAEQLNLAQSGADKYSSKSNASTVRQRSKVAKMKTEKKVPFISSTTEGERNNMIETEKVAIGGSSGIDVSKCKQNMSTFSQTSSSTDLDSLLTELFKKNDEMVDTHPMKGLVGMFPKKPDAKNSTSTARHGSQPAKIKEERNKSFASSEAKDISKQNTFTFSEIPSTSHEEQFKNNVLNVAEPLNWTQPGADKDLKKSASTFRHRSVAAKIKTEKKGTSVSSEAKDVSKLIKNEINFSPTSCAMTRKIVSVKQLCAKHLLPTEKFDTEKISFVGSQGLETAKSIKSKTEKNVSIAPPRIKVKTFSEAPSTSHQNAEKNLPFRNRGLKTSESVKTKTEKKLFNTFPGLKVTPLLKTSSTSHQDSEAKSSARSQVVDTRETVKTETEKKSSIASSVIKGAALSKKQPISVREPCKMNVVNVSEQLGWTKPGADKDAKNSALTFRLRSVGAKMKTEKSGANKYYPKINAIKTKTEKKLSNTFPGLKVTPLLKTPSTCHQDSETILSARSQGLNTRETVKTETEKKSSISSSVIKGTSLSKKKPISVREPYKMNVVNVAEQLNLAQSGADKDPKK